MAAEKLMTAALAVLERWADPNNPPSSLSDMVEVLTRLRVAAYRRCEMCAFFRPPCFDHGRKISGWCGKEAHSPPRNLDDTCKRWKETKP